ncbi:hypothetical protein UFOVP84_170 [uncultured Caudovirales phage]|uniref:Uncharacterized protein n=1 Tax=uncultured Caudovirales phage TaxID=2100421 RepID=A0A6J5KY63_9CAUD|nr:hypothetical protein UFOVP84_170 [uncultured Caudovirales phage]
MAIPKKVEKSDSFVEAKKNRAEKRRERVRSLESKFKGGSEPITDILNYDHSLIAAINWYNINVELKEVRTYVNNYLIETDRKKTIAILNSAADYELRSLGFLCRLKSRDQYLSKIHEDRIESTIAKLITTYDIPKEVKVVNTRSRIDRVRESAIQCSEDIESAIDDFVRTKKSDFDISSFLKSKDVSGSVAKEIGSYYASVAKELEEAQTDADLQEGYSNFTKSQLKKFAAFVTTIAKGCSQQIVSSKVRKPRVKKPVPATKIVAKLKFKKEHGELGLKSINPTLLVDCNEIWTYNVKYRRLAVYRAEKSAKLSVKGSSITGFDITTSQQTMLRTPDEFFANTSLAKKALATGMGTIKTKTVTPSGRLSEEIILLGAFK